jgi:signal transduction histidine kinase
VTFARLELTETLFDFSRTWEHMQLDELPITLLVLAAGLAWFASRRYREAREEIKAREATEEKLATLLEQHKRLAQQHVEFQESERKALARELHDELGQYLHAIKTDAVAIQTKGAGDATTLKRAAAAIIGHCDHLQEVLRSLIGQLRPVGLDVLGLRAALEYLIERAQMRIPERKLAMQIEGDLDSLDESTSLTVYRLIQEGLTNVARHSGAQRVVIQVVQDTSENMLLLRFSDDGRGADPAAKPAGLGILGMRERVEILGGELRVVTAPGAGFSIAARVPFRRRDAAANLDISRGALAYE